MLDKLWTVKETADFLQLKVSTVYAMAQDGRLPGLKIGRTWRFNKETLVQWVEEHQEARGKQKQ